MPKNQLYEQENMFARPFFTIAEVLSTTLYSCMHSAQLGQSQTAINELYVIICLHNLLCNYPQNNVIVRPTSGVYLTVSNCQTVTRDLCNFLLCIIV